MKVPKKLALARPHLPKRLLTWKLRLRLLWSVPPL